jgi:hypothetical protein
MTESTNEIDLRFDGFGDLVSALLTETNSESLADELDYPGRREAFAEEFIGLTVGLGGSVDVAARKIEESDMPTAGYLVPKSRIHIRLKALSWQTAVALVPVIAGIVATGGLLLPLLGATPLLVVLQQAITPLTERDKLLVVAVTTLGRSLGRPVSSAEVRDRLRAADQESLSHIQKALERLAAAGVLEWDQNGFSDRF